ncbi:hypothetical protein CROQUDRAFT_52307 [Cronartium quercuum f. sp. fusiforme G11]|uniref:Uncharacterized protein n=1 Tax=Cronartium quercuum f. sp. fusiforme G11 TaxID=708437 RepID=A0A9P6N747_9BASI|nr:hypothetical protein CROQUDRAFT_52307 [Cronartium quercuum f. sp. fusiforme G11]
MSSNQNSKRQRARTTAPPAHTNSSGCPQTYHSGPGRAKTSELIVKLSDEKAKANYVGPALVKFPDVTPPPTTPFVLYGRKADEKAKQILAGETDQMEFESSRDVGHESACTYLMGIHSSAANTLTLFPTTFHEMRSTVKQLKDALKDREREEAEDSQQQYKNSRTALGTTFGTKKVRRAIQAAARNTIDPESMLHVQSHLTEAITNSSMALPSAAQQTADADAVRPIPPFNRNATSPKEIYKTSDVVSSVELNSIPLANITGCQSGQQAIRLLPNPRSLYINQRIESCWSRYPDGHLNKKEEKRLRILIYISYLLKLPSNRKWTRDHLKRIYTWRQPDAQDCPDAIIDGILQRFTEKAAGSDQRIMTTFTTRKLLCYIAVLCLMHDGFACPTVDLAEDLQEDTKVVHEIFRTLGCTIEKLPANEIAVKLEQAKKYGTDVKKVEKERVARLVVPLVFPEPRRKRQKN